MHNNNLKISHCVNYPDTENVSNVYLNVVDSTEFVKSLKEYISVIICYYI